MPKDSVDIGLEDLRRLRKARRRQRLVTSWAANDRQFERRRLAKIQTIVADTSEQIGRLVRTALVADGVRLAKRRPRRLSDAAKSNRAAVEAAKFDELVERANGGDEVARLQLEQSLRAGQASWHLAQGMASSAERAVIELMTIGNAWLEEPLQRRMADFRETLAGPSPTELVDFAVSLVILATLETEHIEATLAREARMAAKSSAISKAAQKDAERRLKEANQLWDAVRSLSGTSA